jgi:hypothetical protein
MSGLPDVVSSLLLSCLGTVVGVNLMLMMVMMMMIVVKAAVCDSVDMSLTQALEAASRHRLMSCLLIGRPLKIEVRMMMHNLDSLLLRSLIECLLLLLSHGSPSVPSIKVILVGTHLFSLDRPLNESNLLTKL